MLFKRGGTAKNEGIRSAAARALPPRQSHLGGGGMMSKRDGKDVETGRFGGVRRLLPRMQGASPVKTGASDPSPKTPSSTSRSRKKAAITTGRTIAEHRDRPESTRERTVARAKIKRRQALRFLITTLIFIAILAAAGFGITTFISSYQETKEVVAEVATTPTISYAPTIEIIDEDAASTGLTTRMRTYIGQLEVDLREQGITPTRAVVPTGAIREVDFYLDGYSGYLKTTIDRGSGVTAEDAARMLRYLASIGATDFTYIDLRLDGRAYWRPSDNPSISETTEPTEPAEDTSAGAAAETFAPVYYYDEDESAYYYGTESD